MNFWDILQAIYNNELDKSKPDAPLPKEQLDKPIRMSFRRFLDGKYHDGNHNLYIIWKGKQALYVGISHDNIWYRWFKRSWQGHMSFMQKYSGTLEGGEWVGHSPIGRVIATNLPKSLKWTVELRHYSDLRLGRAESGLIRELRPLFNSTYRDQLTNEEHKLVERLRHV